MGYGTIKVGAALYTHSLQEGVDQSMLKRPASCPDPTGQCAICFSGPCGPCQQCLKVKTGACAKCYAKDAATGFQCLQDDGGSLCQKCYKPPAPSPTPPSPTPPSPPGPSPPSPTPPQPDKCTICLTGACAACQPCLSIQTGPCAPCWAKQSNGSACLPDCQNAGCWNSTLII